MEDTVRGPDPVALVAEQAGVSYELAEEQLKLEALAKDMALTDMERKVKDARDKGLESVTPAGSALLKAALVDTEAAIEQALADWRAGKSSNRAASYKYMAMVDADRLAYLTARVAIDGMSSGNSLASVASGLGTRIEDEVRFQKFAEEAPGYWHVLSKSVNQKNNYHFKRTVAVNSMNKKGIAWESWPNRDKVILGTKLLELFATATGLIEFKAAVQRGVKKDSIKVIPTEKAVEWIEKRNASAAIMAPLSLPMVIPPKPWEGPFNGGYWFGLNRHLKLVKTRNKGYLQELKDWQMPAVYKALNALQETRWQINPFVLDTVQTLWETQPDNPLLPRRDPLPEPTRPYRDVIKGEDGKPIPGEEELMAQWKEWKLAKHIVEETNVTMLGSRMSFGRLLWVANRFRDREAIWFRYTLDFRGRVYADGFLNPQGDDLNRGLLRFSEAVEVGTEQAACYLAIHGANTWANKDADGVATDKLALQDRIRWAEDNTDWIIRCAEDPLTHREWMEADGGDKAWTFLAWCKEWAGYQREGLAWKTQLPISFDATCSGLQNMAAMMRDEVSGCAVNLMPMDKPADIYGIVAEKVNGWLMEDAAKGVDYAKQWLHFGVDRKVCKRPTMTLSYGAKEYGFKAQIMEDTLLPAYAKAKDKHGNVDREKFPFDDNGWQAALYLAKLIWRATGETVIAARSVMDWLQQAARLLARRGLPITWVSPIGFPVLQDYRDREPMRIETKLMGKIVALRLTFEGAKLDKAAQSNGVAPNWVHTHDASLLMETVNLCIDHGGVKDFHMIHDSFGVHAPHCDLLLESVKEAFVQMYTREDVLDIFRQSVLEQLSDEDKPELPELPKRGNLDLTKVRESEFFFS